MKRIQRIDLLAKIAKTKADVMAKLFYDSIKMYNKEIKQLRDLKAYEQMYQNDLNNLSGSQAKKSILIIYHNFLDHLSVVIEEQKKIVDNSAAEMKRRKEIWVNFYQKNKMLHNYSDRMKEELRKNLDQKEQKTLDMLINDRFTTNLEE